MSFKVLSTPNFDREIKKLAKKHRSIKADFSKLLEELKNDPKIGTDIGNDAYKIRMAITSKNKGKSGGARIITHLQIVNEIVYLISIYDKSEKDSISDKELKDLIKDL